ncbi:MAG: penicillin-binding protein 2 [Nitriliruptoraceae bacterium]
MSTSETSSVLRLTFLSVVVIALFLALLSRLWFLQVLAGDRYVELADTNRLRQVVTEAPRGDILASGGEQLVRNRPALAVSADRQALVDEDGDPLDAEAERVISRLALLLDLSEDSVLERLTSRRYSPFRPVPIAVDVTPEIVFSVREHQELFPGVTTETLPLRDHPYGTLGAHVVGYLNQISEAELDDERFADYRGGDLIGRAGVEAVYESWLRGTEGTRLLEVNAQNRVLDVLRETESTPGNDLVLSIDLELQAAVEHLLEAGMVASRDIVRTDGRNLPSTAGSAIVMDVDGAVLALASNPTYDPRKFVGGLSQDYADYLYNTPEVPQPAVNRAIQGRYPPGSVFKTVSGAAGVESGQVGPSTLLPCPSSYTIGGNTFRNWNASAEPAMPLSRALMRSCDTYFYDIAYRQWQTEQRQIAAADASSATGPGTTTAGAVTEVLAEVAHRFGFGRRLGIDLPSEATGYIPNRASKEQRWLDRRDRWCDQAEQSEPGSYVQLVLEDNCLYGGVWRGGDAVNTSIGQGEIETTPLQVATSYLAVANGGELLRPRVASRIVSPTGEILEEFGREVIGTLDLDAATLGALQQGLRSVVMEPGGTARGAFAGFPLDQIPVAGKTGTAEQKPKVPYAWFVAYAPADDPQYVVVVSVEEGGGGSQTAAPIARNILEVIFDVVPAPLVEFEAGPEILD